MTGQRELGRPARWRAVVPLVVLLAVVVTLVAVRSARPGSGTDAGAAPLPVGSLTLPAPDTAEAVLAAATAVPPEVLDAVGTGGTRRVPIAVNGEPVLAAGGLPRVLWVGSDDCAGCAAMRWAVVVALARFGTFTGLALTASDPAGDNPGTVGPTFRDASFDSRLLDVTFLDAPTSDAIPARLAAADRALLDRYDAPPYVADDRAWPFVLSAGQYVSAGPLFTPSVLDGLDAAGVATRLSDPSSAAGRAVDGAANVLTAVLCVATGDAPAAVCSASGVDAAAALIGRRTG